MCDFTTPRSRSIAIRTVASGESICRGYSICVDVHGLLLPLSSRQEGGFSVSIATEDRAG